MLDLIHKWVVTPLVWLLWQSYIVFTTVTVTVVFIFWLFGASLFTVIVDVKADKLTSELQLSSEKTRIIKELNSEEVHKPVVCVPYVDK